MSIMWAFSSASAYTFKEFISEMEKKETKIKELQYQKMGLEDALA